MDFSSFNLKNIKKAIDWLEGNKEEIIKKYSKFDCPDYCGLPDEIFCHLESDDLDWIQDFVAGWFDT